MKILVGLLALLFMAGCAEKNHIPSGIIPQPEMQKIFWDLVQADQYADLYLVKNTAPKDSAGSRRDTAWARRNMERQKTEKENRKMETLRLYAEIFELHHVSREDFIRSFRFYLGRPDLTRGLLDSALEIGNRIREEAIANGPKSPVPAHTTTTLSPRPVHPFFNPGVPGSIPPGAHGPVIPGNRRPYIPPRPGGAAPYIPGQGGHAPPMFHQQPAGHPAPAPNPANHQPAKHRPATHTGADSTHAAPPPTKN